MARMTPTALLASAAFLLVSGAGLAQTPGGWGRVSLFGQAFQSSDGDTRTTTTSEYSGSLALRSGSADQGGVEYGVDVRASRYAASGRETRTSIFEAFVGGRTRGGMFGLRLGQMWLDEIGGLGALGGGLAEIRPWTGQNTANRLRLVVFAGLEPEILQAGYVEHVRKGGGFLALEGEHARRSVVGYVVVKNDRLTERSVLTMTNFIPIGDQFHLYQAAEYDLTGPGGQGNGGLNYLFANARYSPWRWVELQGTYRRGRSIDARSITDDQLKGLPVDPRAVEGFLFETYGGRISFRILPSLRVYGGYSRDRDNRFEGSTGRIEAGLHASNVAGSGIDISVADNRNRQPDRTYDGLYASLGRSIGSRVYLSVDYSTSLAVLHVTDTGGIVVERRPKTRRYGLSSVINASRRISFLLTLERFTQDVSRDDRGLLGLTYRF